MRILIFEDEIPAKDKLVSFITDEIPNVEILGWGRSIVESITLLHEFPNVDLIFSDIELLDGSAFRIYERADVKTPIIFCTAFDQYLFQAFQVNGIAYLLKPYTKENFNEVLSKYNDLFESKKSAGLSNELIQEFKSIINYDKKTYKTRFTIKKKEGIKLLNVSNIVNFEANGDFTFAYDIHSQRHIISHSIGDIESKVDPTLFFRINRSEIINVDYLESIEPHFKNRLLIQLQFRAEKLMTSSTKTPLFRSWLDQ